MRKTLGLIVFLSAILIACGVASAKPIEKVGLINYQKILGEYKEAENANNELMKAKDDLQEKLDEKQEALKKKKDGLEKKAAKATDAEKEKMSREFEGELKKLQETYQTLSEQLQTKQADVLKKLNDKISAAINDVAAAKGFDMVVERNLVFFGGTDITDEVLAKLNGGKSSKKSTNNE